jgi:hypothetical protein
MSELFLDPQQPLSTCKSTTCQDCPLQSSLQCHFGGRELRRFLVIALPPFVLGGIGIVHVSIWLLIPWLALILGYFGLVEIRVMCSHCPHYAEPGTKSLRCWANYGSPKLWKYRPGPMTAGEKIVFFAGLVLIAGYALVILVASMQWLLLALFAMLVVGMAALMYARMCSRCMNFACPFNHVAPSERAVFMARNPVIAQAWERR